MDESTRIFRGLHQGGIPRQGGWLHHHGFATLVLAAEEEQPPADRFPGVRVVRFPLDDDLVPWSRPQLAALRRLTVELAREVRLDRRVLVTCQMGLNRSGLIVAATLMRLTGATADEVIGLVRARRDPWALSNPVFEELLRGPVSQW